MRIRRRRVVGGKVYATSSDVAVVYIRFETEYEDGRVEIREMPMGVATPAGLFGWKLSDIE